jgi:hypothetical protein
MVYRETCVRAVGIIDRLLIRYHQYNTTPR